MSYICVTKPFKMKTADLYKMLDSKILEKMLKNLIDYVGQVPPSQEQRDISAEITLIKDELSYRP